MVVRDDDADDYDVGSHESNHNLATNTNHTSSRPTPQVLDVTIMTQKSGLFAKWQLDHVTLLDMGNGKECVAGPVLNFFIYLHHPRVKLLHLSSPTPPGSCSHTTSGFLQAKTRAASLCCQRLPVDTPWLYRPLSAYWLAPAAKFAPFCTGGRTAAPACLSRCC